MSDFDFDELDKAVAGVITPDEPVSSPVAPAVPVQSSTSVNVSQAIDIAPRGAPAARRSSGRFMDVVHPSSDMRTRPSFTPPQPSSPASNAPSANDEAVAPETIDTASSDEPAWDAPLESPFLAGAKVEKRPLGGTPDVVGAPLAFEEDNEVLKLEAPDDPLLEATTMPDPIDFAAQAAAPHAESEDTSTVTTEQEAVIAAVETREEPTPVLETVHEAPEFETPVVPQNTPEDEPVGPASITQQYTEHPSSEQASGAIYDTENYHQPLQEAVKKRSGAWIILWIALLVIFGAAAGVAFYLFILPLL